MYYKCENCGHIFEEGEQSIWSESRGEFWGSPCSEKMSGCPICKGDYYELKCCTKCGDYYDEENLIGGLCEKCVQSYRYDYRLCDKLNNGQTSQIELDDFLLSQFSKSEIENILRIELEAKAKKSEIDCIDFINEDKFWFADALTEYLKEDKK